MKRVNKVLLGAAGIAVMAMSSVVVAATPPPSISTTRHNLGTSGTGTNHLTAGTAEICVFCHTPHSSDTSAPAPLWNRALGATNGVKTGYTTYDNLGTVTLDGSIAGGTGRVGSVSLACLSCHDGTMGMDSIINQPGSGMVNTGGARPTGWTWTGSRVDPTSGKLQNDPSGTVNATMMMLGTDLQNDHPVGIQYAGGCLDATGYASGGNCTDGTRYRDKDFKPATKNPNKAVWWVDTGVGTPLQREVTDMILYSRVLSTGSANPLDGDLQPFVECASCHDPHVGPRGNNEVAFLRVSQANSGVCLACHVK